MLETILAVALGSAATAVASAAWVLVSEYRGRRTAKKARWKVAATHATAAENWAVATSRMVQVQTLLNELQRVESGLTEVEKCLKADAQASSARAAKSQTRLDSR